MSASQAAQRAFAVAAAAALLTACADGGMLSGKPADADAEVEVSSTANPATAPGLTGRDIEAPEVFQAADEGLWDGRPSLGGIWVAHADVKDPERVIIRNDANGKFVIGALFRRERDIPGPRIQVSSDAAVALGMLAGSPASLNITALKRSEPEAPPEPETAVAADVPISDEQIAAAGTADLPEGTEGAVAAAAFEPEKPRRKGLFGGLFRRKDKALEVEPMPADASADPAAAIAAETSAAIATTSLDGPGAAPASAPAAPAATDIAAAAPVIAPEEPPRKKGLFGRKKQDDIPGDPADLAPATLEMMPASAVVPGEAGPAPLDAIEEEPRRRKGLFGLGRKRDPDADVGAPLSAFDPVATSAELPPG